MGYMGRTGVKRVNRTYCRTKKRREKKGEKKGGGGGEGGKARDSCE